MADTDHYTRSSSNNDRTGFSLARAFKCAGAGVGYTFKTQRNIRVDACFAVAAVVLGLVFSITPTQWAVICVCIGTVMGLECANTAVESVVDLVSPEYHLLAKHAKDAAAGAVFLAALASVAVACFVFIPPFLALFGVFL